jgi:hypothetical protein
VAVPEEVNDVSDVLSLTNGILLSLWILLVGWRWVGPTLMTPFVEGPFVGELSAVEIAERVLLLIIFGVAALGAVFGRRIVASRRIMHFVSAPSFSLATAAVFVFALGSVTYWDSFKGELWFGYGLGFALICAIGAVLLASIAGTSGQRQWFGKRTLKWISITTGIFGLCMYLPSVIQPTTGIIDLSHSRYLLNETLAQVAGVTPLGDFSPHYTSLHHLGHVGMGQPVDPHRDLCRMEDCATCMGPRPARCHPPVCACISLDESTTERNYFRLECIAHDGASWSEPHADGSRTICNSLDQA